MCPDVVNVYLGVSFTLFLGRVLVLRVAALRRHGLLDDGEEV